MPVVTQGTRHGPVHSPSTTTSRSCCANLAQRNGTPCSHYSLGRCLFTTRAPWRRLLPETGETTCHRTYSRRAPPRARPRHDGCRNGRGQARLRLGQGGRWPHVRGPACDDVSAFGVLCETAQWANFGGPGRCKPLLFLISTRLMLHRLFGPPHRFVAPHTRHRIRAHSGGGLARGRPPDDLVSGGYNHRPGTTAITVGQGPDPAPRPAERRPKKFVPAPAALARPVCATVLGRWAQEYIAMC